MFIILMCDSCQKHPPRVISPQESIIQDQVAKVDPAASIAAKLWITLCGYFWQAFTVFNDQS